MNRILTSGQSATNQAGAEKLRIFVERSQSPIVIVATGGSRLRDIRQVLERSGVREAHSSASIRQPNAMKYRDTGCSLIGGGARSDEYVVLRPDEERIKSCCQAVKGL